MNGQAKFEVRSITRSWDTRGYLKTLGSPWIRPRSLFSKFFNGLLFRWTLFLPLSACVYLHSNFSGGLRVRKTTIFLQEWRFGSVREKVCNNSKKRKSHVFWILKKPFKNVQKRAYSFTGHLITQPLITQLPEVSNGKSPTSNILLRSTDTRNYATDGSEMAQNGSHSGSWELNYSDHWAKYTNSFCRTEDYAVNCMLLMTFYDFLIRHFKKKRKKSCFFEIWKKRKIRILEHCVSAVQGHSRSLILVPIIESAYATSY